MTQNNKPYLVTASQLANLIEILYVLVIDYIETGDGRIAQADTAKELKKLSKSAVAYWGEDAPALRDAVNAALTGRNKTESLALLGEELRQVWPQYRMEEHGFTSQELELLKSLISYLRTDSEGSLAKIKKQASLVRNPFISNKLAPDAGDQSHSADALRKLIFKLVGRNDTRLTPDEVAILKDTKPVELKKYRELMKEYNQAWTDAMVSYIRKSGHHALPYQEVVQFLEANGLQHSLLPGFTGFIDDMKRLHAPNGEVVDGMPSPVVYSHIQMNPKFGKPDAPEYVFVARKPDGSGAPFYTEAYKRAAAKQKYAKVAHLSKKMESIRAKWFASVKKFDITSEQCVASVILEMLFEFSARIGSLANATEGKPTFGISTLQVRHVSVQGNGDIMIRYSGKAGVKTAHKISKSDPNQKWLIKPVLQLMENKDPRDRLFTYVNGNRLSPVGPAVVNRYFKAYGAGDVTVHKIRTYHGTKIFQDLLLQVQSKRPPKTEKEALDLFNKMAEVVGKKLNHVKSTSVGQKVTGTTAIQNYIDPAVSIEFWRALGFRPPKMLEKFDV